MIKLARVCRCIQENREDGDCVLCDEAGSAGVRLDTGAVLAVCDYGVFE